MPGRGTPKHSIRVTDDLWQAALELAKRRGETLNGVIRAALERYVNSGQDQTVRLMAENADSPPSGVNDEP